MESDGPPTANRGGASAHGGRRAAARRGGWAGWLGVPEGPGGGLWAQHPRRGPAPPPCRTSRAQPGHPGYRHARAKGTPLSPCPPARASAPPARACRGFAGCRTGGAPRAVAVMVRGGSRHSDCRGRHSGPRGSGGSTCAHACARVQHTDSN